LDVVGVSSCGETTETDPPDTEEGVDDGGLETDVLFVDTVIDDTGT
jgi:hypothetical protein